MFLLFGGDDYYAGGGMADFRGRFATVEDAVQVAENQVFANAWSIRSKCEWWTVVDASSLMIVAARDDDGEGRNNRVWWQNINRHTAERLEELWPTNERGA